VRGRADDGRLLEVEVVAPVAQSPIRLRRHAGALVTGLITERGVAAASRAGLAALYPERKDR